MEIADSLVYFIGRKILFLPLSKNFLNLHSPGIYGITLLLGHTIGVIIFGEPRINKIPFFVGNLEIGSKGNERRVGIVHFHCCRMTEDFIVKNPGFPNIFEFELVPEGSFRLDLRLVEPQG